MAIQETSAVSSAAANGKHGHSLISDQKFHQLYALALDLHRAAEAGMASLEGCEAALAGVSVCLVPGDVLVSECASSLFDSGMGVFGTQHASLQVSPATGDCIVAALSAAVADRMKRNHRVTVLFIREESGGLLLDEARAVAAAAKLPVIFVEQGSEQRTVSRRPRAEKLSAPDDLISIPVDARDVIAMYRVAHESIARARQGSGPTRIVCLSMQAGVRGGQINGNDAVARLEEWLMARRLPVQEWRQQIMAERNQRNSVEWQESSRREEIPQNAA